jgi:hypothetical protein
MTDKQDSNPIAWKLVPVEPTEKMFAAMQTAGLAAWDAVMAAELNNDLPTYPETYARQQAWTAALDAAPDAPSAEPVALETVYETIIQWDEGGGKRSRRELARRIVALYAAPQPDHREAMRLAIEALETSRIYLVHYCKQSIIDRNFDAIDALRAALGERDE